MVVNSIRKTDSYLNSGSFLRELISFVVVNSGNMPKSNRDTVLLQCRDIFVQFHKQVKVYRSFTICFTPSSSLQIIPLVIKLNDNLEDVLATRETTP